MVFPVLHGQVPRRVVNHPSDFEERRGCSALNYQGIEGQELQTYVEAVSYLLKLYATDDEIAKDVLEIKS